MSSSLPPQSPPTTRRHWEFEFYPPPPPPLTELEVQESLPDIVTQSERILSLTSLFGNNQEDYDHEAPTLPVSCCRRQVLRAQQEEQASHHHHNKAVSPHHFQTMSPATSTTGSALSHSFSSSSSSSSSDDAVSIPDSMSPARPTPQRANSASSSAAAWSLKRSLRQEQQALQQAASSAAVTMTPPSLRRSGRRGNNLIVVIGAQAIPGPNVRYETGNNNNNNGGADEPNDDDDSGTNCIGRDSQHDHQDDEENDHGAAASHASAVITLEPLSPADDELAMRELIRRDTVVAREVVVEQDDDDDKAPSRTDDSTTALTTRRKQGRWTCYSILLSFVCAAVVAVALYFILHGFTNFEGFWWEKHPENNNDSPTTFPSNTLEPTMAAISIPTTPPSSTPTGGPTMAPTQPQTLMEFLCEISFDEGKAVTTRGTPQFRAFTYVSAGTTNEWDGHIVDLYVLATFHFSTSAGDDSWTNTTGWFSDQPPCLWYGVQCDDNGFVQEIDLAGNGLNGQLPPELGLLGPRFRQQQQRYLRGEDSDTRGSLLSMGLTYFDISNNNVGGDLPEEIELLEFMVEFDVSRNQLSGSIPTGLEQWKGLEHANFADNNFSGNASFLCSLNATSITVACASVECECCAFSCTSSRNSPTISPTR